MGERTCSIDGCNGTVKCRGWCSKHYQRWYVHGDPTVYLLGNHPPTCSVEGCDKPWHYSNGWCKMHYQRWRKHGSLDDPRSTLAERLLASSVVTADGCREWQLRISTNGYGQISVGHENRLVHRVSYEEFVGPIPDGLTIDHLCENKPCIEPSHLEAVPSVVNTRRASKGQFIKTHCKRGHPFDEENTRVIPKSDRLPNGGRSCRKCQVLHSQAYQARKKAAA